MTLAYLCTPHHQLRFTHTKRSNLVEAVASARSGLLPLPSAARSAFEYRRLCPSSPFERPYNIPLWQPARQSFPSRLSAAMQLANRRVLILLPKRSHKCGCRTFALSFCPRPRPGFAVGRSSDRGGKTRHIRSFGLGRPNESICVGVQVKAVTFAGT